MCVLRDTYLVDDPAYREIDEEDTSMQSQGTEKVHSVDEIRQQADQQADQQVDLQEEKPRLQLVTETAEELTVATQVRVEYDDRPAWQKTITAYYWCRVCKQKTPASMAKSCDCGVTMCNSCWEEWDVTCPICGTDLR